MVWSTVPAAVVVVRAGDGVGRVRGCDLGVEDNNNLLLLYMYVTVTVDGKTTST